MSKSFPMNVSLTEPMEKFVRQKVAAGDYETASEVVREGLRLLHHRMGSIRAGRAIPSRQVKAEMASFKKKWKKERGVE